MSQAVKKLAPTGEDLVRLRDEIAMHAMHAMSAMVIAGGWGDMLPDGSRRTYRNMRDYSDAAYGFADQMLAARERK